MPKLSVIIPVYNTEKYLEKCLNSVLEQTYSDYEIIVVSDASPGDCKKVVELFPYPIKYIELSKNAGTHIARSKGVEQATGEYICFIDPDDFLLHERVLEELVPRLADADILTYNFNLVFPEGYSVPCPTLSNTTFDKILTTQEDIYYEFFKGGISDGHPAKITKKALWDKCVPYFPQEHIIFAEDGLISFILLYFAEKVITTSYYGYGYFQPYESATKFYNMNSEKIIKTLEDLALSFEKVEEFARKHSIYEKYKTNILEKKRVFYNWIRLDVLQHMEKCPELKSVAKKAFDPFFIYEEIKQEIKQQISIKPSCFLSIIMPVFNTEPYLKRCLDSIITQGFTDYEIIVVDDCSPKNCQEIVESYNNPKVKYFKNPVNMGSAWSRLHGLSKASGEYIYFVDSDDWLVEGALEKMYNHLNMSKEDVLYFLGYWATEEKHWSIDIGEDYTIKGHPQVFESMFVNNIGRKTLWCRTFKRDVVFKGALNMPHDWISVADDWILNLYTLWHAKSLKSVNEYYYYYYQENPNAITNHVEQRSSQRAIHPAKADHYLRQVDIVFESLEKFLTNHGILAKYINNWNFYKQTDFVHYHKKQMLEGVQQYFMEEIINNPENALKEMRNMTHNRASALATLRSLSGTHRFGAKEAVKLLINKIKGRNKYLGIVIENTILTMWKLYKKIKH